MEWNILDKVQKKYLQTVNIGSHGTGQITALWKWEEDDPGANAVAED